VDGLVERPLVLSYEEVLAFPGVKETAILYCPGVYENQPVREWYGVSVTTLLTEAGLQPVASRLIFYATDGYKTILSIERIAASGAILAYAVDGAPLSTADGYPFRLVSAEMDGDMWIGWVYRIEVS
jgi:sulfane dehydrogenase subunit SoxC